MDGRTLNCMVIIRDACIMEIDRAENHRDNCERSRDQWTSKLNSGLPASSECPEVKSDFQLGVFHGEMEGAEDALRAIERIERLVEALIPFNVR